MIFNVTPRISIGLQLRDLEAKELLKLHLSHIAYIAIQSKLGYLIGEKESAANGIWNL
jgi:hypothetical protein